MSNDAYNEMMVQRIDDHRLEPPDPEGTPVYICSNCGAGIYEGEPYLDTDDGELCTDCIRANIKLA